MPNPVTIILHDTVGNYGDHPVHSAWLREFHHALVRGLAARVFGDILDDVTNAELAKVYRRIDHLVTTYTPTAYANERLAGSRAVADWLRMDNGQQGRGTRYRLDDHGQVCIGHEVVAGDAQFQIGRYGAWDRPSKQRRHGTFYDVAAAQEAEYADHTDDPRVELLRKALLRLPADQQDVVRLCDFEGLTEKAAAHRLGVARETVSRRHARAKRNLREFFEG